MKKWVEGGIIGLGVNSVLSILIFIVAIMGSNNFAPENTLGLVFLLIFSLIFFPISFLIGALIGRKLEKEKRK